MVSKKMYQIAWGIFSLFIIATSGLAQTGSVEERSFEHDGASRSYLLYVPVSYDGTAEWPLVISYHGFGWSPVGQQELSRMDAAADAAQYLVVYPQGLEANLDGDAETGWNILGTLFDTDDIGFSLELIEHVKADYAIDPLRIHLTGFSIGAAITYDMACAHSNIIASIAGVGLQMGPRQMAACAPDRAVSFLQIHGTIDPFTPFDGFDVNGSSLLPALETASFWGGQNNCSSEPIATEIEDVAAGDNSTVTLFKLS
jgi:polyhydroxybutyrate depolymerase